VTGERPPVIRLRELTKVYGSGEAAVHALAGVNLTVEHGEYVAVMGASGSGKSTLMNIIGCLDVPTAGMYHLDGIDVGGLSDDQLSVVRNRKVGFVFQSFNLIPRTSALANVEMPLAYRGVKPRERREAAIDALAQVGLVDRMHHEPTQLSGGQQQRVAIARALVTRPSLLLADEPTGALDSHASAEVLELLDRLHADNRTVVVITHEAEVAAHARRTIRMRDGNILSDELTGAVPA
jgi:putative ABC transport system ATP-binding protein